MAQRFRRRVALWLVRFAGAVSPDTTRVQVSLDGREIVEALVRYERANGTLPFRGEA